CPRASEAAGAFLFGLVVAIFARIHPSPRESLRLDDSDYSDTPAVARQSGKIVPTVATERSAWLNVHPGSFPFNRFAGWYRTITCAEWGQDGLFTGRKHNRQHAAWDAQSRTAAAARQSQCVESSSERTVCPQSDAAAWSGPPNRFLRQRVPCRRCHATDHGANLAGDAAFARPELGNASARQLHQAARR